MKPSHTVALSLLALGWYLLVPPRSLEAGSPVTAIPPLSQWQMLRSFDNAEACEGALTTLLKGLKQNLDKNPSDAKAAKQYAFASDARCVASDDPRLKEKVP